MTIEQVFGQVIMQTQLGLLLYRLCKEKDSINSVVEIGTWYGMGSTKCIIEGLKQSNRDEPKIRNGIMCFANKHKIIFK